MAALTASEVAQMQSDLDTAQAQLRSAESENAVLANERDLYREAFNKAQLERDYWMTRATEQTSILEATAATLTKGIERQRLASRARQEENLNVGHGRPRFLNDDTRTAPAREPIRAAGAYSSRLPPRDPNQRPGAEPEPTPRPAAASAAPRAVLRTAGDLMQQSGLDGPVRASSIVRTDIIDHRLPAVEFGDDDDTRNLKNLAGNMGA
jgi:hypothetical protein